MSLYGYNQSALSQRRRVQVRAGQHALVGSSGEVRADFGFISKFVAVSAASIHSRGWEDVLPQFRRSILTLATLLAFGNILLASFAIVMMILAIARTRKNCVLALLSNISSPYFAQRAARARMATRARRGMRC